jgi:hypothetical protein
MPQWMQDHTAGWPMIRANLPTFFVILVLIIGAVWFVVNWSYSGVLTSKTGQLELQDRQLADYKQKLNGANPEQAKSRIDDLEARLIRITARRWDPLTDSQIAEVRVTLRKLPKPYALRIVYGGSDCVDLAESLSRLFNGIGWVVKPEAGAFYDAPDGIVISQRMLKIAASPMPSKR